MSNVAFDNSPWCEERRRMTVGIRRIIPHEEEATQQFLRRIERLQHERERAILLYPLPTLIIIEPETPRLLLPPGAPGVFRRTLAASLRWLKHPLAQWDV